MRDEVAGGARIALARLSASSVSASASAPAPASLALVCDVSGCGLSAGCVASSGVEAAGAESVGGAAADALVSAAVAAVGAVDASSMRGDDVDAAEAPEAPEASALPGVGRVPSLASSRASANDWLTSSLPSSASCETASAGALLGSGVPVLGACSDGVCRGDVSNGGSTGVERSVGVGT